MTQSVTSSTASQKSRSQGGSLSAKERCCTEQEGSNSSKVFPLVLPWIGIVLLAFTASVVMTGKADENDPILYSGYTSFRQQVGRFLLDMQQLQDDEVIQYNNAQQDASTMATPYSPPHHQQHHAIISEDHEPLFPLSSSDYWGFFLAMLGLMIAAGGGIGGGGILVPIYILVMGFSPKHAIPLSNVTVLGGAVANTILNLPKRHPLADRPLIDWDMVLVMEPLTVAGALIGAFLNKILPELILTVLLVLLLSFTAYTSLKKALKMYQKETLALQQSTGQRQDGSRESELTRMAEKEVQGDEGEASQSLLSDVEKPVDESGEAAIVADDAQQEVDLKGGVSSDLREILEKEKVIPMTHVWILASLFVVVLSVNLAKGGGAFRSPLGIKCGSNSFWMANAIMLLWIFLIAAYVRQFLVHKHERKQRCHFVYMEGDIQWNSRTTVLYPIICCLAGFFAGMFGIGGGIVKGPLMLAMGVHPAVSAASTALMIFLTSISATTSFVVFGLLIPDYAVICMLMGFFATLVGQVGLSYLMKKAKAQRNSYIAFSIGFVVLISAFLMTIQSLLSMAAGEHHHSGGICGYDD